MERQATRATKGKLDIKDIITRDGADTSIQLALVVGDSKVMPILNKAMVNSENNSNQPSFNCSPRFIFFPSRHLNLL